MTIALNRNMGNDLENPLIPYIYVRKYLVDKILDSHFLNFGVLDSALRPSVEKICSLVNEV